MKTIEVVHQYAHMQGFSSGNGHMYWSFTTGLTKTTLGGIMKAQVEVHGGHLGDCDYHDGKIYASYLGNALPDHPWNDWTSFKLYVFDAEDLRVLDIINLDICDEYKRIASTPEDTRGFQAVDGVAIAPDPVTGENKIFIACALNNGEKFSNQIILQHSMDGKYETEYHIPTGNTVFGIQNLDYDAENKEFWFTTYGGSEPYQAKETLFCVSHDFKEIKRKYNFSTPYGLDCLGKDGFYASCSFGVKQDLGGLAYPCTEEFFKKNMGQNDVKAYFLK